MSCCGQKRQRFNRSIPGHRDELAEPLLTSPAPKGTIYFEYIGATAMTVLGPITGRRYRFGWPYATVAVDRLDAASFATVPNLRQVNSEEARPKR